MKQKNRVIPEEIMSSVGQFPISSFLANRDLGRRYLLKCVPIEVCYPRNNMGIGFAMVGGCGKDRRSLCSGFGLLLLLELSAMNEIG